MQISSLFDRLVVLVCLACVSTCGLVQLRTQRTHARAIQCRNNLRQIGLGFHNYHSAYKRLPMGSGGTDRGSVDKPMLGNANRLSALVGITPFMEGQAIWERISNPLVHDGVRFPSMGPAPWVKSDSYPPWDMRLDTLVCSSDPDRRRLPRGASYVLNYGDGIVSVGAPYEREMKPYPVDRASKRGAFTREHAFRFRDFLDGLSNTLLVSESKLSGPTVYKGVKDLALNPSLVLEAAKKPDHEHWPDGRNSCWADGSLRSLGFQTILPPNSPSATSDRGELEGVLSASSHHADGVFVLMGDGAVQFVSETIDAGDPESASIGEQVNGADLGEPGAPSPYGVWGGLGSRANREVFQGDEESFSDLPTELTPQEQESIDKIPMEEWNLANGITMRARLLEVVGRSRVTLIDENNKTTTIRLTDLTSKDAYRAVRRSLEQK